MPPLPPARALAACRCCQRSIQSSKRDTTNRPSPPSSCRPTLLRQGGRLRDAARHTHMHGSNTAGQHCSSHQSQQVATGDGAAQPSGAPADVALGLVERKVELALHGGRADLAPVDRDLSGSKEKSHARCLARQTRHGGHVEPGRELSDPSRAQPPQQQGSHRQDAGVMWLASAASCSRTLSLRRSTCVPGSVTTWPFTRTCMAVVASRAPRLPATAARANGLCRRLGGTAGGRHVRTPLFAPTDLALKDELVSAAARRNARRCNGLQQRQSRRGLRGPEGREVWSTHMACHKTSMH